MIQPEARSIIDCMDITLPQKWSKKMPAAHGGGGMVPVGGSSTADRSSRPLASDLLSCLVRILYGLCLALLAAMLAGCASLSASSHLASAERGSSSNCAATFSAIAASRAASVVDIATLRRGPRRPLEDEAEFAPRNDLSDALPWPAPAGLQVDSERDVASGIVISSDGLILTSAHVTADVDELEVRLDDGRRFAARQVGIDRRTDIALLKIEASGLPVARMGDSSQLMAGDWVASIGAPFGFHGSLTTGVVSAIERMIGGIGDVPFIQTDVAINPGSSGSPLFNRCGEIVAINSLIYSGNGGYMGISFAVPSNLAMKIASQLRTDGAVRRAHLGAEFQELTPELSASFGLPVPTGALVVDVAQGGPSAIAGLQAGDIVLSYNGKAERRFFDFLWQIADDTPDASRRIEVWRAEKLLVLWVQLSEQRGKLPRSREVGSPAESNDLGLTFADLPPARRTALGSDHGLLILQANGAARSEGIRAGDVLLGMNHVPIRRLADFRLSLAQAHPDRPIALLLKRDGRLVYVAVRRAPALGESARSCTTLVCFPQAVGFPLPAHQIERG
jgi:serine protease Do